MKEEYQVLRAALGQAKAETLPRLTEDKVTDTGPEFTLDAGALHALAVERLEFASKEDAALAQQRELEAEVVRLSALVESHTADTQKKLEDLAREKELLARRLEEQD